MLKRFIYILPVLFFMCSSPNEPTQPHTWQALNSGLPETVTVNCIAEDSGSPLTLYIGTFKGVYKKVGSADWQQVNAGLTLLDISALDVVQQNAQTIYAGTWGNGVFKSTNGGTSWQSIWSADLNPHINAVLAKNANEVWVATENGLYHSTNAGAEWKLVRFGGIKTVAVSPVQPNMIFIGVDVAGNFRSDDYGATWKEINTGVHTDNVSYAAANCYQFADDNVMMSTEWVDLYTSQNNGDEWQHIGERIKYKSIQSFEIDSNNSNRLWAVSKDEGVFKSTDGAASWFALNEGIENLKIKSLIVVSGSSTNIYAGTLGKGIYKYVETE